MQRRKSLVLSAFVGAALLSAAPAAAQRNQSDSPRTSPARTQVFRADLHPVSHDPSADSGSNVTAKATLVLQGNELRTVLVGKDLSPNLPHAMHIHGELQAQNECPSLAADTDGNGLIDTLEGMPAYGPIDVSLTTSGGTSAEFSDALALDRFPVANRAGVLHYNREFTIPSEFADALGELHIVVHGEDLNDNGEYDFGPGKSSLSGPVGADVPLEAELPVACGTIK